MDSDFDGVIGKSDLKSFLLTVLRIPEDEVTSPRVDRLFKLLDHYKRGFVDVVDFVRIFKIKEAMSNKSTTKSTIITPEKQKNRIDGSFFSKSETKNAQGEMDSSDFYWCKNAKQQLGLVIARSYEDFTECFESKLKLNYTFL